MRTSVCSCKTRVAVASLTIFITKGGYVAIQNSVFEGEISESDLKLRDELEQIIESSDSVTMYKLRKKNIWGQ